MKISKKTEYALKAMIELSKDFERGVNATQINDIADREDIPPRFLEQILLRLKNSGLLLSKRGLGGGYALSRPPQHIHLGDIVKEIEGPLFFSLQETKGRDNLNETTRALNGVMAEVNGAVRGILGSITLRDITKRITDLIESKQNVLNYVI